MNGRRIYHARGKVLGGSSSINGMIFQRGNALDYERWAHEGGLDDWDYAHCLPYFKKMETCVAGADEWRGGDGPLDPRARPGGRAAVRRVLRRRAAGGPLADRRRQRIPAGGVREVRPQHPHGRRWSAARAYLHPAMKRPNLEVRTRTFVERVVFDGLARGRASQVGGATIRADEVILCGGAINSPQLLQLSGVGDPAHLEPLGVPVVHDLPAVGENLQDHLEVYVQRASTQPVTMAPYYKWRNRPLVGLEVAAREDGPGRLQPLRGGRVHPLERRRRVPERDVPLPADRRAVRRHRAAGPRLPAARRADVLRRARLGADHVAPTRASSRHSGSTTSRPSRTGASGSSACAPRARSSTRRRSSRSTAASCRPGRRSRRTTRSSTGSRATPRRRCIRRARARWGRSSTRRRCASTALDGLRVVDASVFPFVPNGNIYAPTMMVAERAADLIRGNTPLAPADVPFYRHELSASAQSVSSWRRSVSARRRRRAAPRRR